MSGPAAFVPRSQFQQARTEEHGEFHGNETMDEKEPTEVSSFQISQTELRQTAAKSTPINKMTTSGTANPRTKPATAKPRPRKLPSLVRFMPMAPKMMPNKAQAQTKTPVTKPTIDAQSKAASLSAGFINGFHGGTSASQRLDRPPR